MLARTSGRPLAAASLAGLLVAAVLGIAVASAAPSVRPVTLPGDHGAHPRFAIEWWYTAGTVAGPHGRRYFWFATIWSGGPGQVARVNVVDLRADRIVLAREYLSVARLDPWQRRLNVGGFRLTWRPRGMLGRWSIDAPTPAGRLRLELRPVEPYLLHGNHGIIEQGAGGPSAYYSEPRLRARGVIAIGGRSLALTGTGWLDHQWGNFAASPGSLRWNWFACQLDDGSALMLYQFLGADGRPSRYRAGTLLTPAGRVEHLTRFTASPRPPYVQPLGARRAYPLRWRLSVPGAKLRLSLRALARAEFIANRFVPSFWEGPARIAAGGRGECIVESSREVLTPSP